MAVPQHVYEIFIRATPGAVWAAITEPELTRRYFHGTTFDGEVVPDGAYRLVQDNGADAVDGTIEVVEPGRRLVMTWHVLYDAAMADEPPSRVEWLLRPANADASITRLTLRHFDLGASPLTSANVALGWVGVLDALKTLLETGEPLGPVTIEASAVDDTAWHRQLAVAANGEAWALLGRERLDAADLDELLERAHASAYHWRRAAPPEAPEQARAAWLLARCHTIAGHGDLALHHAERCATLTRSARGVADFDRAYAHEALARALALVGRADEATEHRRSALAVEIADDEDRAILAADLAAEPWFGLPVPASV